MAVVLSNNNDRRVHGVTSGVKQRTDDNLDDRIATFRAQINNKYVYRIPLRYICGIGKINFPTKIGMKISLTLETVMKKLFETKKSLVTGTGQSQTVGTPGILDSEII